MDPEKQQLLYRYFTGEASDHEIEKLDGLLANDSELREQFLFQIETDSALREIALEQVDSKTPLAAVKSKRSKLLLPLLVSLGVIALLAWISLSQLGPKPIAVLVSSEDASWESDLPTAPGSKLMKGYLKLHSGIAMVRFNSGVEVQLEAPAHLVLDTPMRGKLLAGSAIIDVPEPAIGFIIETPESYAVDHGTRFSVSVDGVTNASAYEVLSGEISVHHETSGTVVELTDKQVAKANKKGVTKLSDIDHENGELPSQTNAIRLTTAGNEYTVIRDDDLNERVHPDFLMVKKGQVMPGFDRKSVFSFDLADHIPETVSKVQLRLNLVPCGLGYAARLPKKSRFSIYGFDQSLVAEMTWAKLPNPEAGVHLGSFEIPRSQSTGSFLVETDALRIFIENHKDKEIMFLLVRDTDEKLGNGLVHAFASSQHPTSSGPTLTIQQ